MADFWGNTTVFLPCLYYIFVVFYRFRCKGSVRTDTHILIHHPSQ